MGLVPRCLSIISNRRSCGGNSSGDNSPTVSSQRCLKVLLTSTAASNIFKTDPIKKQGSSRPPSPASVTTASSTEVEETFDERTESTISSIHSDSQTSFAHNLSPRVVIPQDHKAFVPPGEIGIVANNSMTSITSSLASTCSSAGFRKRQAREEERESQRRESCWAKLGSQDELDFVESVDSIESNASNMLLAKVDAGSSVIEAKWRPKPSRKVRAENKAMPSNKSNCDNSSTKEEEDTRSSPELSEVSPQVVPEGDKNGASFDIDTFEKVNSKEEEIKTSNMVVEEEAPKRQKSRRSSRRGSKKSSKRRSSKKKSLLVDEAQHMNMNSRSSGSFFLKQMNALYEAGKQTGSSDESKSEKLREVLFM